MNSIDTVEERMAQTDHRLYNLHVLPHVDVLRGYALRLTGDEEEAKDLLQETCLKAYRFFDSFEIGTNCKAWLYRIMKNSFINRYRRAQKKPDSVSLDNIHEFYQTIMPDSHDGTDLQREVFSQLLSDEVSTAVEKLPTDFRTAVILSDIEDFTYEEIADFVNCPVGTVRSRLHRGRRLLREYLEDYAPEYGIQVSA
jgi:RNA polymerase sigma-70 factor (ECF subfamily)